LSKPPCLRRLPGCLSFHVASSTTTRENKPVEASFRELGKFFWAQNFASLQPVVAVKILFKKMFSRLSLFPTRSPFFWLAACLLVFLSERVVHLEALNHPLERSALLVLGLVLFGHALTGHLLKGGYLMIGFYLALRGLSQIKVRLLEQPLRANDLLEMDVAEAGELASHYPLHFLSGGLMLMALVGVALLLCWKAGRAGSHWRLGTVASAVLAGWLLLGELRQVEAAAVSPESVSVLTLAATFFDEPPRFESAREAAPHTPEVHCPERAPNLFLVLEESTFRPADAQERGVDMDFFAGNVFAGPVKVHVNGGMTHLSEFAWMTGFPHTAMRGENTFPQVPLEGRIRRTLPELLKACGYTTSAIYPTKRNFRNAARWYASVGFDHLISGDDLAVKDWHVRDSAFFEAALEHVRSLPSDKPHFIYVLTIAQHGPHDAQDPRKDYMQRLQHSAQDMRGLKLALQRDAEVANARPWVLSWFGDHRTSIDTQGPDRLTTWAAIFRLPAPQHTEVQTAPVDLALFNRLLQREVGVAWQPFSSLQDTLLAECRADFHACSAERKDQLVRTYIDMGGFLPEPASAAQGIAQGDAPPVR
jgi:hypothetical protein